MTLQSYESSSITTRSRANTSQIRHTGPCLGRSCDLRRMEPGVPRVPECSQREAVTALCHLYPESRNTATHMRNKSVSFNFFFSLCSDWRRIRSSQGQLEVEVFRSRPAFDPYACARWPAHAQSAEAEKWAGLRMLLAHVPLL